GGELPGAAGAVDHAELAQGGVDVLRGADGGGGDRAVEEDGGVVAGGGVHGRGEAVAFGVVGGEPAVDRVAQVGGVGGDGTQAQGVLAAGGQRVALGEAAGAVDGDAGQAGLPVPVYEVGRAQPGQAAEQGLHPEAVQFGEV